MPRARMLPGRVHVDQHARAAIVVPGRTPPGRGGASPGHGYGHDRGAGIPSAVAVALSGSGPAAIVPDPTLLSYRQTVLADNPVGYWKLDETAGTNAADASTTNNAGTYTASPTLGVTPLISTGKAATFDGASNYVAIPGNAAYNPSGAISLECWFKTAAASGTPAMMCEQTGAGGGDKFLVRVNPLHKAELTLWDNGDNAHIYAGNINVNDNTAHHFVGTYDGTTMLVYIDGAADGAGLAIGMTLESAALTWQIGGRLNNLSQFSSGFPGTIDEVAIYATALSAGKVAAHYAARTR